MFLSCVKVDWTELFSSHFFLDVGGIIAAGEITPILASQSEKLPENLTKYFLDSLLNYMVSEVSSYLLM